MHVEKEACMLESKQYLVCGNFPDVQFFNPVPGLLKKLVEELTYLVTPQDTTGEAGQINTIPGNQAGKTRGIIKVLFWLTMAISLPLVLAQVS